MTPVSVPSRPLPSGRRLHRIVHLLLATLLGVILYSPLGEHTLFAAMIPLVLYPGLLVTGLLLWKGHAIRRWIGRRSLPRIGLPRSLLALVVLALVLGAGHHVDHVVRGNHVGWPLTDRITPFTGSLLSYPIVLASLYLTWRGRVGARFWAVVSTLLALPVLLTHFGPMAVEPPADVIGVYDHHAVGVAAFAWLLLFTLVMCLLVLAGFGWWRRRRAEQA